MNNTEYGYTNFIYLPLKENCRVAQKEVDALCAHLLGTYFANRNTSSLLFKLSIDVI